MKPLQGKRDLRRQPVLEFECKRQNSKIIMGIPAVSGWKAVRGNIPGYICG